VDWYAKMNRLVASVLLSVLFTGCVSKPNAKVGPAKPENEPLAIGDCVVLEPAHRAVASEPWRETIGADGYLQLPLGQKLKIVGKTLNEARDLIASHYSERNMFHRVPRLLLLRCEEYDRMMLESK
jgi:protein involved in polysaccharide export with SLBB domain